MTTLDTIKEVLKFAVPSIIAIANWFRSAKKTDLNSLRRRVSLLERAFDDLFSLVQQFLDETDTLVDGLPHGLRPPFRSHISAFRSTIGRQRERLHEEQEKHADKTDT